MTGRGPLTLALETSTRLGSLALGTGEELLAECTLGVQAVHSETVLPEADRLLQRCGREPGELERVVVGAGPGSFTGVRIAASIARGLCHGGSRQLLAYSSLAAVAAGSGPAPVATVALFSAREDEVYAASLVGFEPLRYELEPTVLPVGELLERVEGGGRWYAGEGALRHREAIEAAGGRVLPEFLGIPRGGALLWLARCDPDSGLVEDPEGWEPGYVRRPGARAPGGGDG